MVQGLRKGHHSSVAHVQRQMDRILRGCRNFARAYIDDIIIFSRTLEEYIKHLRAIFGIMQKQNIALSPSKAFLGYRSLKLLGQRVDSLSMITHEDKTEAILALVFLKNLQHLEKYLGTTGWLRNYILAYAVIIHPLQERKTRLYRQVTTKGFRRKFHAVTLKVSDPTKEELDAYRYLQDRFRNNPLIPAHFIAHKILYLDIDASKEIGVSVQVYQLKDDDGINKPLIKKDNIDYVCFLSCELRDAERRYWITELVEVRGDLDLDSSYVLRNYTS